MAFTNDQLERYSRHIILKEVGAKGQKKLLNAKVLIIGAGGLGAPASIDLTFPQVSALLRNAAFDQYGISFCNISGDLHIRAI